MGAHTKTYNNWWTIQKKSRYVELVFHFMDKNEKKRKNCDTKFWKKCMCTLDTLRSS